MAISDETKFVARPYAPARDEVSDRPTGELVQELFQEAKSLVREEIRLAKAEIRSEAKGVGKSAGLMGAGGIIAHVALFCFAAFVCLLLAAVMPAPLAAFLTTVIFGGVGAALLIAGKKRLKAAHLKPETTLKTLQEDSTWMKNTWQSVKSHDRAHA
jgi:hypothetical protein